MAFKQILGLFSVSCISSRKFLCTITLLPFLATSCSTSHPTTQTKPATTQIPEAGPLKPKTTNQSAIKPETPKKPANNFGRRISAAAMERTKHRVTYDGRYVRIGYPWGDVPDNIGVCTDVVIRSYRRLGVDLQQQVHKDMSNNFNAYPNLSKWQLNGPDTNIDHRRVYNLRTFLNRHAIRLPVSHDPQNYQPGDLVTWQLGPGQGHIGIVVEQRSKQDPKRHLIVHNIAEGPKMEDVLFRFPINGHYRYSGKMRYYRPTYIAKANSRPGHSKGQSASVPGLGNIPAELLR